MARREGKKVEEVEQAEVTTGEVSSGPMPVETVVQEEQLSVSVQNSAEEEALDKSSAIGEGQASLSLPQDLPRPEMLDTEQGPTTASSTSSSRDKALPVAPTEESITTKVQTHPADEAQDQTTSTAGKEYSNIETQSQINEDQNVSAQPLAAQDSLWSGKADLGVTQSGFLPSPSVINHDEAPPPMAQSAFLPERNMERYANPFARLDPSLSNPISPGQAPPSQPGPGVVKAKANDVWANRSRLSASDAARSLAGRF